ncbi:hypothetical protein HS041_18895 [Planomonospora sp. ID67723]|uniref:hypothetical protein n=1 Tax=Planomonospora sp. ID67723 TaxID=2738134 RepID=UPI0018C3ED17|nr:hypothetical protein [Planomonospora sp. ID67723]MBG0829836.1 hypothetical protein [Planomonospora sp. ID67723]
MSIPPAARRLLPCAVVTMLTLTACSSLLPESEPVRGQATAGGVVGEFGGRGDAQGGPGDSSGAAPSPTASAPPSPAALTPEDYRAELEQARGPVREALKKLAGNGGKSLDRRVKGIADAVDDAVARLEPLSPPVELAAQHGNYVGALRSFGTAFDGALQDVETQQACTGPAVLTGLEKYGELSRMKDAAAGLSGYPADVVSVKAAGQRNRRLPNGRIIRSESRTGRGSLKVHNGGKRDAVVVMLRGGKRVVTFYVRGKGKVTISGVRDGKYKVFYTTGTDWDAKARAFTRSCEFTQFGKTVPFKTTYSGSYIRWNNWTITLHSVKGGTVRSKPLKPGDFPG